MAVACSQAKGHYFGTAKDDIPAGSKITVFVDKPQKPNHGSGFIGTLPDAL